MARARNIKPGFYKNEDLAECSIWARFIFPGLWMLADREGRLEDRPKRIKAELLAFDSEDVDPLLDELQEHGFLERYKNSDGSFIQISKFLAHQAPHYSEKPSTINPPSLPEFINHEETRKPENSEKHKTIKRGPQPPDSLNPDSLNPDSKPPIASSVIPTPSAPASTQPENPTRLGLLCKRLRTIGIDAAPHLAAWSGLLVSYSDEQIIAVAEKVRESKPGERIHLNYLVPILADTKAPQARGSPPSGKQALRADYLRQQGYTGGSDGNEISGGATIDGQAERVA